MQRKPELTDEQNQTDLTEMIKMDQEEIEDCLQFLGIDQKKWDMMFGSKREM